MKLTSNSTENFNFMYQQRIGARAEYLQEERERIKVSPTLAEKFQDLKSLSLVLNYFGPGGISRHSEIKYTVNLGFAKSVFCFDCPSGQCIGGMFDLSTELARAVADHREAVNGELLCQGWQSQTTIDQICCG